MGSICQRLKFTDTRFWSKIDRKGDDECWHWTAFKDRDGYGKFRNGNVMSYAHRIAWEKEHREELGDRLACHKCDNPSCCNPAHIYAGDPVSNGRDASERGLLRSCSPEDHPSAKLTWPDVEKIKSRLESGESPHSIASDYPVRPASIYKIRDGKTWVHRT